MHRPIPTVDAGVEALTAAVTSIVITVLAAVMGGVTRLGRRRNAYPPASGHRTETATSVAPTTAPASGGEAA